nr:MAG TPA: hypothetical protein [Caudoviricetes sp.]
MIIVHATFVKYPVLITTETHLGEKITSQVSQVCTGTHERLNGKHVYLLVVNLYSWGIMTIYLTRLVHGNLRLFATAFMRITEVRMLSKLSIAVLAGFAAGVYCHEGQYGMMVAVLGMFIAIYLWVPE